MPYGDQLNRVDLANIVYDVLNLKQFDHGYSSEGARIVKIIFNTIVAALRRGEDVDITRFGTFKVIRYKPRHSVVFNNRLREHVITNPVTVKFIPNHTFKRALRLD